MLVVMVLNVREVNVRNVPNFMKIVIIMMDVVQDVVVLLIMFAINLF